MPAAAAAVGAEDHRAFSAEMLEALLIAPWRGNLRELLNVFADLQKASRPLDYQLLPHYLRAALANRATDDADPDSRPGRDELVALLAEHGGNISATARTLGKHRQQIQRWIRMYGIES